MELTHLLKSANDIFCKCLYVLKSVTFFILLTCDYTNHIFPVRAVLFHKNRILGCLENLSCGNNRLYRSAPFLLLRVCHKVLCRLRSHFSYPAISLTYGSVLRISTNSFQSSSLCPVRCLMIENTFS